MSKPIVLMAAAFFFSFSVYLAWSLTESEFRGRSGLAELEREFKGISKPPGSLVGTERRSSKAIQQVVSSDFTSSLTPDEIFVFFDKELVQSGWMLLGRKLTLGRVVNMRYCKGDLEVVVEMISVDAQRTRYYFGVRWDGGPFTKSGC
jgi:hypothetical protein